MPCGLSLSEVLRLFDIYFAFLSQHYSAMIQYLPVGSKHSPFMALSLGLWQHNLASSHSHAPHSLLSLSKCLLSTCESAAPSLLVLSRCLLCCVCSSLIIELSTQTDEERPIKPTWQLTKLLPLTDLAFLFCPSSLWLILCFYIALPVSQSLLSLLLSSYLSLSRGRRSF